MAIDCATSASTIAAGTPASRSQASRQRHPVCGAQRLPMADAAAGLSKLEHGLRRISQVADGWTVATDSRFPSGAGAQVRGQKSHTHCGHPRQSVDPHGRGGEERGFDAGKKITGRKRHLAVDTLGLILTVVEGNARLSPCRSFHFISHTRWRRSNCRVRTADAFEHFQQLL
jgi:hypothetical protein